jgi:hypothetical protein
MVTGESTEYAVKPLRREGRVISADLWFCRVLFVARGPWAQPVPDLPCALSSSEGLVFAKLGRDRAARPRGHGCLTFEFGTLLSAHAVAISIAMRQRAISIAPSAVFTLAATGTGTPLASRG